MLKSEDKDLLSSCLWSSDLDSLDMEGDKFLIIERLLEHGGDRHIKFLFEKYKPEDIVSVVKNSSYLSPKTVNYWCLVFGLKREETRCFSRPFQRLWVL